MFISAHPKALERELPLSQHEAIAVDHSFARSYCVTIALRRHTESQYKGNCHKRNEVLTSDSFKTSVVIEKLRKENRMFHSRLRTDAFKQNLEGLYQLLIKWTWTNLELGAELPYSLLIFTRSQTWMWRNIGVFLCNSNRCHMNLERIMNWNWQLVLHKF